MLKKILHNSILTALIRGSSFGVRIIALLITAHFSTPAEFGTIALFFTIAEIARLIGDFGVDTYTMRSYASSRNKIVLADTLRAAASAKLVLGVVTAAAAALVMYVSRPEAAELVFPFALMVVSPLVMNLPVNYFIAKMRGKYVAFFIGGCGIASLAAFAACYAWSSGAPMSFLVIPAAESLVGLLLVARVPLMRRSVSSLDFQSMSRLLKLAAPIGTATVVGITYGRMDVFFLEKFRTIEELGLYSFAVRMVEPFQFVAGALAVNAYSHISSSVQVSTSDGIKTNSRYRKVMLAYALLAFLMVVVIACFIVDVAFPAYRETAGLLLIAALALIVKCGNLVTTSAIQALGKFKIITLVALWNFAFLGAMLLLLVPRYGAHGALLAVLGMETVNFVVQNLYLKNLFGKFERA